MYIQSVPAIFFGVDSKNGIEKYIDDGFLQVERLKIFLGLFKSRFFCGCYTWTNQYKEIQHLEQKRNNARIKLGPAI